MKAQFDKLFGTGKEYDEIEANGDASTVNLKILVNNVEVDLVPELVRFIQSLDAQFASRRRCLG